MRYLIFLLGFLLAAILLAGVGDFQIKEKPKRIVGDEYNPRMNPVWSPDGSKIAFTGRNYAGLWIMNQDGSNVRQISDEFSAGYGFEWANDSKALVYRVAKYDGYRRFNAVKMFDIQTGEAKQVTDYKSRSTGVPRWNNSDQELLLLSKGKTETVNTGKTFSISAEFIDKKKIAFMQNLDMYVYDNVTKSTKKLDPLPGSRYLDATISPDFNHLAFQVVGGNMYVMRLDGTNLVDLGKGYRPCWSFDGTRLIYMICQDDGYNFTSSDLYIIDKNGESRQQLTNTTDALEMNPTWSPDGKKIAYDRIDEGAIYVMEVTE